MAKKKSPNINHILTELISDIRVAMLTTFPRGGKPHARPMYTQALDSKHFDGSLWFMTDAEPQS